MDTLLAWLPLIVWLGLGGWAFRHHAGRPDFDVPNMAVGVFIFSILLAPMSAGIAVYELQHDKRERAVQ